MTVAMQRAAFDDVFTVEIGTEGNVRLRVTYVSSYIDFRLWRSAMLISAVKLVAERREAEASSTVTAAFDPATQRNRRRRGRDAVARLSVRPSC